MRDEKRRTRDDDAGCLPKKRRSDDSPSHLANQGHTSAPPKPRSHVPMSERQQFALLRQMETEEVAPERGDSGVDGPTDGTRGDLYRDKDGSTDHGFAKEDCEGVHTSQHHYHHSSGRERPGTSSSAAATHSIGDKSTGKSHGSTNTTTIQGALMHLIKTGDLDTLKQLVREGANVNEQDEHGWTALHEFSARNLSRLVAYLLRHGARPDLTDRNGDTALHAAARANHARVLRTLLRHNADPMIANVRGERPLDLCQDTESSAILNQHMELIHGHTSHSLIKHSSTSRLQRPHHHPSHGSHSASHVIRHSAASAILSNDVAGSSRTTNAMATPDLNSDSDDACSTPGLSNPLTGATALFSGVTADLAGVAAGRSASPSTASQRGFSLEHTPAPPPPPKPMQKKDPYAFEDEADESPDHSASLYPSSSGLLSKSSSSSVASGTNATNTTSPTGSIRSRVAACAAGPSPISSVPSVLLTSGTLPPPPPPPPPLLSSPAATTTTVTLEPSCSDATVSPGPPLRLRFAKEAGQYTLMEQQQQQQQQNATASSGNNNQDVAGSQSASAIDPSDLAQIGAETDRAPNHNHSINTSPSSQSCPVPNEPNHESGTAPSLVSLSNSASVNTSTMTSATAGVVGGSVPEDIDSPTIDFSTEEISTAQKVPPLRIKVASGPSNDNEPAGMQTTANNNSSNNNIGGNHTASESVKGDTSATVETRDARTGEARTSVSSGGAGGVDALSASESTDSITGTVADQADSGSVMRDSIDCSGSGVIAAGKHKSPDTTGAIESHKGCTLGASSEHMMLSGTGEPDGEDSRHPIGCSQASDDGAMSSSSATAKAESESGGETGKEGSVKDTTHRHRSGRTLRSHTAAQREREEKERHNDTTPIKKRKLRSRTDTHPDNSSARSDAGSWTPNDNLVATASCTARSSNASDDSVPNESSGENLPGSIEPDQSGSGVKDEVIISMEPRAVVATAVKLDAVKEERDEEPEGDEEHQLQVSRSTKLSPDADRKPSTIKVEFDSEQKMDTSDSPGTGSYKSSIPATCTASSSSSTPVTSSAALTTVKPESSSDANADGISYLSCPAGPDDNKQHPELLMFENPFEKSAAIQRKLRELINNLVEVHPKAPCGYPDYLLVTRNYLLASQTPALTKKTAPPHLKPAFVDLFNEQEEERYAQALKHQSEREHLRLCAEQAVLRAQTRAALAVANLSKPLSFCSVLAYKDLTYVPPASKADQRDEENVRDRFTPRTFIGWLEDIKDTFQQEKKKLLCRQLHEAESLMMVQRLDWESKLKESQLHDYGTDVLKEIPHYHVPLIHVPNDFPLFAHDPVHRTSLV